MYSSFHLCLWNMLNRRLTRTEELYMERIWVQCLCIPHYYPRMCSFDDKADVEQWARGATVGGPALYPLKEWPEIEPRLCEFFKNIYFFPSPSTSYRFDKSVKRVVAESLRIQCFLYNEGFILIYLYWIIVKTLSLGLDSFFFVFFK